MNTELMKLVLESGDNLSMLLESGGEAIFWYLIIDTLAFLPGLMLFLVSSVWVCKKFFEQCKLNSVATHAAEIKSCGVSQLEREVKKDVDLIADISKELGVNYRSDILVKIRHIKLNQK